MYDALQSIRTLRAHAKEWNLDPNKIGIICFSAGAELTSATAVLFEARPDFVGIIYSGPMSFARNRTAPPIPRNVPPAFIATGGSGDCGHAIWAIDYYSAKLSAGIPNIEMHIYGNGRHPGDRMTGGLTDRNGIPLRHVAIPVHRLLPSSPLWKPRRPRTLPFS